jgi:polysaccharide export outer membrane protein
LNGLSHVAQESEANLKRLFLFAALCAGTIGCADLGHYVWANDLPDAPVPPAGKFVLAPGDAIYVRVFNQDTLSGRLRIRPDGRITIPFINDVPAAGATTVELAQTLQVMLRDFINKPVVTVTLDEVGTAQISVLGEVARPGVYAVERGQGVLRALASAGGLTEFAHKDRIFVMRANPGERIRFSFQSLATPGTKSASFRLQNNDVVVVQ